MLLKKARKNSKKTNKIIAKKIAKSKISFQAQKMIGFSNQVHSFISSLLSLSHSLKKIFLMIFRCRFI